MCPFELLHALPLALIAGSIFLTRYNLKRKLVYTAIILLSLVGLFSGHHVHTEHSTSLSIIDPCVGYFVSIAISGYMLLKEWIKTSTLSKKQK